MRFRLPDKVASHVLATEGIVEEGEGGRAVLIGVEDGVVLFDGDVRGRIPTDTTDMESVLPLLFDVPQFSTKLDNEHIADTIDRIRMELAAKAQPLPEVRNVQEVIEALRRLMDGVQVGVIQRMLDTGRVPRHILDQAVMRDQIMRVVEAFSAAEAIERGTEIAVAQRDGLSVMSDVAMEAAQRGRGIAMAELRKMGVTGVVFDDFPATLHKRVSEAVFSASRSTTQRIVGDVMRSLSQAAREGLGIDDASAMLESQFERMKRFELNRIARTEIQAFQNLGAWETQRELGIEFHEWVTADDDRVRASHADIHGEIVRTGVRFSNGLRYPLDRTGPKNEWINCRCRAVPFILGPNKRAPHEGPFYEDELVDIRRSKKRRFFGFSRKREFVRDETGRFAEAGGIGGAGASEVMASAEELREAREMVKDRVANAPVPSPRDVAKARRELERSRAGIGRKGGDSRGGSARDRRRQRENLFEQFGGSDAGYVVCHGTGMKMHWTEEPSHNPNGYPMFERGRIFTKEQGGRYILPNLLPESLEENRRRGAEPLRTENLP